MHIIVYRQNRLPTPRDPLHLNLRGEKDEEDEEDDVGEGGYGLGVERDNGAEMKEGKMREKPH